MYAYPCVHVSGGQDIQSRVESGHARGEAGVVRAALLFEMLGDALAMGRDLVRTNTFPFPFTTCDEKMSYRPEDLHPFASAIDEPELKPPEEMVRVNRNRALPMVDASMGCVCHVQTVLMRGSAPAYVRLPEGKKKVFEEHPKLSLEEWHKEHNEYVE
jgi:hypothetical protein